MDFNTETYHLWFPLHLWGWVAKAGEAEMIAGTVHKKCLHATVSMGGRTPT